VKYIIFSVQLILRAAHSSVGENRVTSEERMRASETRCSDLWV
jgi:hypothetical protein